MSFLDDPLDEGWGPRSAPSGGDLAEGGSPHDPAADIASRLDPVRGADRRAIEQLDRVLLRARSTPSQPVVRSVEASYIVRDLHRFRCDGTPDEALAARRALAQLAREIVRPYEPRGHPQPWPLAAGSRIETALGRAGERVLSSGARERLVRRFGRQWNLLGFALSMTAAGLLLAGRWGPALALLVVRTVASLFFFTAGLPADLSVRTRFLRVSWGACVLAHLADAVLLSAAGFRLLLAGRPMWGMATVFAALAMLTSTLARVAALQDGNWMPRLRIERFFRGGALMAGLAGTVWLQHGVPQQTPPLLAIGAAGALGFAALESARTLYYARLERRLRAEGATTERFLQRVAAVAIALDAERPLSVA